MARRIIVQEKAQPQDDNTFQNLRKNEREFRKKLIIDATRKILQKKNLNTIAMREIAGEVGVAPASLYSYFRSQEELFLEVFLIDLAYIDTMLKENLGGSGGKTRPHATEHIGDAVNHLIRSETTFQMISFLMTERNIPDDVAKKIDQLKQTLNENVIDLLKMMGVKNPDKATSHAFFASILGTIILFRNSSENEMSGYDVSIKDIIGTLINVFKASIPAAGIKQHRSPQLVS